MHICRSPRALSHRSLLANFDVDTAEIDPFLLRPAFADGRRLPRLAGRFAEFRPILLELQGKLIDFFFSRETTLLAALPGG